MNIHRLRSLRERKKISQGEAAKRMGIVRTTYSNYEAGNREPDNYTLKVLSDFYGVTTDYLLGTSNHLKESPLPYGAVPYDGSRMERLPILGIIRAGEPIYMSENIEGYELVEPEVLRGRKGFALRVKGDSMTGDYIFDGDKVIVVVDEDTSPKDIVVVAVNGYEATLKRVKCENGLCMLLASNTSYEPMMYPASEVHVIGKVIQARRDF